MAVKEQVTAIENGFDVSNHTFLNQIIAGLQTKIDGTVPGLTVSPIGKTASKGNISLSLVGQITLEPTENKDEIDDKVRQLMDTLKNPSNLLSLLK